MRLRRTSAIAAIAVAVAATTAAVYPSAPADRLQPMPALTSPALSARYTADAHQIARAASAASRAGNTGLARSLQAMRGGQFLDFNPAGQGLAVYDQWLGQPVHQRTIHFRNGAGLAVNDGNQFYVIE